MLKVKEYSSFEAFEQDEHRQDVDLVAIVNKPNGMVCADLITDCKMWQTAVNRFFKALAGDERFDGWQETITECIKEGFWQDKALTDGKYTGGYFWEVEDAVACSAGGKSRMTRKEMFDLRIASDGFRYAVRKALFECSKFPPCTERMIVEGRLAEALYFSERMMEKTYKDLETEEKTNVG